MQLYSSKRILENTGQAQHLNTQILGQHLQPTLLSVLPNNHLTNLPIRACLNFFAEIFTAIFR